MELADTTDLKSVARKSVRVQAPPALPFFFANYLIVGDKIMEQEKASMAQQAKTILLNSIKDPFGHLLGLSFYIVGLACGIWCVTIALGFAASILGIF